MPRLQKTWCVLVALLAGGLPHLAQAGGDAKAGAKPPPEVVKAWTDTGAKVGWMEQDALGFSQFHSKTSAPAGAVPAFQLDVWKDDTLSKLPDPGVPFGLSLWQTKVTDAGLKELAGLKSLHSLLVDGTEVTDAGMKELAGLQNLRSLALGGNVTDAGLQELAGLKNLQAL